MQKLTKSYVAGLKEAGDYRDSELAGFYIRVSRRRSGQLSKTYLIHARAKGQPRNVSITIGKHGIIGAEQARVEAKRLLALLAQGINPNEQRREATAQVEEKRERQKKEQQLQAITLEKLLKDYLIKRTLKTKTAVSYGKLTRRLFGDWLALPITQISRDMIQDRHLKLTAKHPAQANLAMRVLRALFTYAIGVYEDADGKPLLTINPVDRLKHAKIWNRVPRRQTVIRPHQLRAWYQAVQSLKNETARDVLMLEMFAGLRHSEAISLRWEHVDFQADTIMIKDTKNHEDHMLPMSSLLRNILQQRYDKRTSLEYVFPGTGKHGYIADIRDPIKEVIAISGVSFTEHDLRRTFVTTAESLDISYYSLKRLLNHKTGNDPTAGYIVSSAERLRQASQRIAADLASHMGMIAVQGTADADSALTRAM